MCRQLIEVVVWNMSPSSCHSQRLFI